ncbi:WecB/TagA/CpsF family glycosyltransferase [Oscillatoria salina]|uniref:WecB/TagA/CpsF family glycosyltransferase n=1 Tax=Oscillatoria salina TaxID=331517 RepID=UPI001CCA8B97|nr:WecB/TagA/CpsF family glycosyltransferase [Oscillatoria salina]MBZ8179096.1 WecB/TagA/CpsF family glycosyltransferase [Oscillatoria salina IIICB1]
MNRVNLLNIQIDNLSLNELLEKLKQGGVVYTPNVDHLIKLQKDSEFYQIYQTADFRVCDSQILLLASKFLGQPIREKISGSDLFPAFCDYYKQDRDVKIFLLGGPEGVADRAQKKINARVGRQIVVGSHTPSFGFEKDEQECQKIINLINNSGATVLAIGVGAPKQEKWIFKYKNNLKNIQTFLAIGATIEFEAGAKKRAPKWMSQLGLEWLFRLILEPKRLWKRYLVEDIPFLGLILHQKLSLHLARTR